MLTYIWLVVLCVVAVPGGSLVTSRFLGLGVVTHTSHPTHTTHTYHTTTATYNGSYWSTTSLYSFVTSLGEPSQLLVTTRNSVYSHGTMPDSAVAEEEGARASNIQLVIKYPSFSWEGNQYESFKTFKSRTTVLMEGPTKVYKSLTRLQLS